MRFQKHYFLGQPKCWMYICTIIGEKSESFPSTLQKDIYTTPFMTYNFFFHIYLRRVFEQDNTILCFVYKLIGFLQQLFQLHFQ